MGERQAARKAGPQKADPSERSTVRPAEAVQSPVMALPVEMQAGLLDLPGVGEAQTVDALLGLQRTYGNRYVQRLVADSGSPGEPIIQRDVPTDAEVEASQERAGVQADFPEIWGELMTEADRMAGVIRTYQDWQRATTDQDMADRLFGAAVQQAMSRVRSQFLNYLIGGVPSYVVGVAIRAITAIQETADEREWQESRDFRREQIYVWLLKQTALCIASDERGVEVNDWDDGVQGTYSLLVSQTVAYENWLESDDAQEFSRRAAEARGGRPIISSGD